MIVFELLHLKMKVTVSEPCDVIRVGIYHEKFQLDQVQNGLPAATSDRQIFPIMIFMEHFFMYRSKIYTIYPFH